MIMIARAIYPAASSGVVGFRSDGNKESDQMNAQNEKNAICQELQGIINELNDIANGIQSDFRGIGSGQCANAVRYVSNKCRTSKNKLQNINVKKNRNAVGGGAGSFGGGGGGTRF